MKETKEIKCQVTKVTKDGKTYYNISIYLDGMKVQVETKFLNNKQKALLRYKLAKLMGDVKNAK